MGASTIRNRNCTASCTQSDGIFLKAISHTTEWGHNFWILFTFSSKWGHTLLQLDKLAAKWGANCYIIVVKPSNRGALSCQ